MSNGRSLLGYLWQIVAPAVGILVTSAILDAFFRDPPMGTSFALFVASGMLPYAFFMEVSSNVGAAVRFSRQLLNYPNVTFMHALLARFILLVMTKLVVYVVVLAAIVHIYDLSPYFDYGSIGTALALAFFAGFALGAFNCLLLCFIPLWDRIWALITRPLFLFSAVIYPFDSVPLPYRDWLWWNPIIHMVGLMRRGIYPTYEAAYVSVTYITSIILIVIPVALFFLRRYWREMLET